MALLDQYPEYALQEDESGQKTTKPWVSGPSPLSLALMSAGLGMLDRSRPRDGWSRSGLDTTGLSRGGLLGIQTYIDANRNLQDQRSAYYDHLKEMQSQALLNQRFLQEEREKKRLIDNFPEVLKTINNTGRPEFQDTIPMLQSMFAADPTKASAAAMNIISQLKTTPGEIKIRDIPGTDSKIMTQDGKFVGQVKGSGSSSIDNLTKGRLRSSLLSGTLDAPQYIAQYDMLLRENGKEVVEGTKTGASKTYLVSPQLGGLPSKFDYIKNLGLNPEDYGVTEESSSLRELIGESKKKEGSEEKKLRLKVKTISLTEGNLDTLLATGFDPTKQEPEAFWNYLFNDKPIPVPNKQTEPDKFTYWQNARSYENMAMTGSQMFGYLVSGAAVRPDEMKTMRQIWYALPGDNPSDVARKKALRDAIVKMSKEMSVAEIAQRFEGVDLSNPDTATNALIQRLETPEPQNLARIQPGDGASQILARNGIPVTTTNIQKLRVANPTVIKSNGEVYGPWQNYVVSFRGLNPVVSPQVNQVPDLENLADQLIQEELSGTP
jgi:hypothetical protein